MLFDLRVAEPFTSTGKSSRKRSQFAGRCPSNIPCNSFPAEFSTKKTNVDQNTKGVLTPQKNEQIPWKLMVGRRFSGWNHPFFLVTLTESSNPPPPKKKRGGCFYGSQVFGLDFWDEVGGGSRPSRVWFPWNPTAKQFGRWKGGKFGDLQAVFHS